MTLRPLIAIFGTTGVGKSNLAIELALHLKSRRKGARVINADAMQVYAGLDVLTNKVPESERQGVEHLLMGFKKPGEQYVVGQWVKDAISAIDESHMRDEIPIVVGGTFNRLTTVQPDQPSVLSESIATALASLPLPLLELYTNLPQQPPDAVSDPAASLALHRLLQSLDPCYGGTVALEGYAYRTLCFWLYAEPNVLQNRLDSRVDKMLESGLLDEVGALHDIAQQPASGGLDYTLGIYQSIGFKEFNGYLTAPAQTEKAYQTAAENMKVSTRQYARRQISWIRNKLLPAIHSTNAQEITVPTYLLDATNLGDKWDSDVRGLAIEITQKFLDQDSLPDPPSLSEFARTLLDIDTKPVDPTAVLKSQRKVVCTICTVDAAQPFMVDEDRFAAHLKGRAHGRIARRKTPEQHREIQRAKQANRPPKTTSEAELGSLLFER
ncbi:tRNA isopentenyltransferase [Roridomyces roridus]|uniref:tRNA dimethylallyltransferase n=1 Tax=Roridomyces roridus TaxID=1738132 RepID=A0AAD7FQ81_9AGAR|nr:tRNA isopentenyltransferase [Roridomyces roridus]